MATLCWAPAAGLLGLLWAACLVCARAGAPAISQPVRAVAAATTNARLLRRAMVMACSLGRPSERRADYGIRCPSVTQVYAPDTAGPEPKSVKDVKAWAQGPAEPGWGSRATRCGVRQRHLPSAFAGRTAGRVKICRRRPRVPPALITQATVDQIGQGLAQAVPAHLLEGIGQDGGGDAFGRIVGSYDDARVRPQRTGRRQRFGLEHVEGGGVEFCRPQGGHNVGVDLQAAPSRIDKNGTRQLGGTALTR